MGFDMQARINIDLVAYAVGRAITCKGCGNVLDTPNAVLVEPINTEGVTILCKPCWLKVQPQLKVTVTTTSGRTGWVSEFTPVSQAKPEQSEARIDGEQGELF